MASTWEAPYCAKRAREEWNGGACALTENVELPHAINGKTRTGSRKPTRRYTGKGKAKAKAKAMPA